MQNRLRPGQLLVISYALVDLMGTFLLMLPAASTKPGSAPLMEAWFTATSALTVTGLTVVNTAGYWTMFGHGVILVLMQIGGLGLMVLTTIFFLMLGLKIHLGQRILIAQDRNHFNTSGVLRLVQNILILTLVLESIGALLLALLLPDVREHGFASGLMFVVFHAVSAFNGAGFDLTGESLIPFVNHLGVNMVVIALILSGSLGYVVLQEIKSVRRWRRLSLHSRMVLLVTGLITLLGSIFFYLSENDGIMDNYPVAQQIVTSLFQAVTRTAGFTTIPVLDWTEPFLLVMILMMFVGASPGSVGGGIKTTTFGTVVLAIWSIVRGKKEVVLFEREIDPGSVTKAFTVTVMTGLLAVVSTLTLMIIDQLPFMPVLFEVVSAMSTVGLSMGITTKLSAFSQVIIGFLMFLGRIGVFTLIVVLTGTDKRRLNYIKEDILIG